MSKLVCGWLKDINDINNLTIGTNPQDLFAFKINYNDNQTTGLPASQTAVAPLFNGNISETFWRTAGDNKRKKYGYQYDNLNRLTNAIYQDPAATLVTNSYNESISYDKNGNIQTLNRKGYLATAPFNTTIDNLTYSYGPTNKNELRRVADGTNLMGFKNGTNTDDDYAYDANGNMTIDKNKGITAISYNHLNLPVKIDFGTNKIEYLYNAAGQKIQKKVTQGSTITTTEYLGGYQYKTNVLEYFPHAEGYVKNTAGVYSYVFNYTDHLGNVRVSYSDTNKNGIVDKSNNEILEESNYYPFGLKHEGYNPNNYQPSYKYKYNGKELQDELGLNFYDYGARNYDPAIGRFMNIDRLAEKFETLTPYQYAGNTPTYFIDVNGEYIYINDPSQDGKQYRYQNGTTQHQVDGKWVDIDGNANLSSFVLNTVAGLYHLENSGETGKGLVNHFSGSENDVTFQYKENGGGYEKGIISLDHFRKQKTFIQFEDGFKLETSPFFITIGHELAHGRDPEKINFMNDWYTMRNGEVVPRSEIYASHYENLIRAESGYPLRSHYSIKKSGNEFLPEEKSTLIDKRGNSVYYGHKNSKNQHQQTKATIIDGLKAYTGQILKARYNYNEGE